MSVLDSAKDYIKNEMAYDINLKGEKKKKKERKEKCKDLYTKWEAIYSKEKKWSWKIAQTFIYKMRGHYFQKKKWSKK